jgi:Holliday junction DNA helicase RuvB
VDDAGLDKQDRRYLETLIGVYEGGPTGVEALAATMNIPADTLSDEIEPYLLREQFIIRSPRGRVATAKAYQHLGRPPKNGGGALTLFD